MTVPLNDKFDFSSPELVSVFDELPLWSSYFGAVLLNEIPLLKNGYILDIGCGAGFPILEIAQRSGGASRVFGIDPWSAALNRLSQKIRLMDIRNVELVEAPAESLPFENNYFDLVVSNNGINNVRDSIIVMKEIFRVLKEDGKLIFTVNLPGTMNEFYSLFREALARFKRNDELIQLENHIYSKRKTLQMNLDLIARSGLIVENVITNEFRMRFSDGTAMFNHYFIRLAFLDSWKEIITGNSRVEFFEYLEEQLNMSAGVKGELSLTIPFACFTCKKETH